MEDDGKKIFLICTFLGFQLQVTVIACWEQVLTGDVTVMSYFIILVGERCVTVLAGDGQIDVYSSRRRTLAIVVFVGREFCLFLHSPT